MDPINSGAQMFNQATSAFNMNNNIASAAGDSKSSKAMEDAMERSDASSAKMIDLQSRHAEKMKVENTLQAMQSAEDDAANKKISSTAQNAKGISY
ncbi:MAG: hypothetical protein CVV08_10455 [Gammaproteobacteria bacterium HGW-Gammaproteobacteria-12]|nr:MAG: hypothetical protein CVV08_10455 [Gammaproteobacteria bacterium HGW-Gammaproteobacteria-12]